MRRRKIILDVGCGEANCSISLAKNGYNVIGVEKNPIVFEKAKANVNASKEKKFITLYQGDIRDIELNENLDRVLFNFVLMFVPKKDAMGLIEKFYKKLRTNGEMLIKLLMSNDIVAKDVKNRKKTFFPSKEELRELKENYKGELEFLLLKDKPHGSYNFSHTHSAGILRIIKTKQQKNESKKNQ